MSRPRIASALVVLALGCSPPLQKPTPRILCTVAERPIDAVALAGESSTLTLGLVEHCSGNTDPAFHRATDAVVEVFDPDGVALPFTATAPVRTTGDTDFANTLAVTFTPKVPGPHRLTARFEPSIGQTAQAALVGDRRADAGVRLLTTLPADCLHYAATSVGTVVCSRDGGLATERGQVLAGQRFAVEGSAVWRVAADGEVDRFDDDGGTLVPTHHASAEITGARVTAAGASGGALYVAEAAGQNTLWEFRPGADGGFARDSGFVLIPGGGGFAQVGPGFPGPAICQSVMLAVAKGPAIFATTLRDGRLPLAPHGGSECRGIDEGVVWVGSPVSVFASTFPDGGPQQLALGRLASDAFPAGHDPRLSPVVMPLDPFTVAAVANGALQLRAYPLAADERIVNVSGAKVFARNPAGALKVFER